MIITIEVYRLLVHYPRYHRIDLNLLVEVGVAAIIAKVVLVGVDKFTMQQLLGMSVILLVLGDLLWVHMRERRYGKPLLSTISSGSGQQVLSPRQERDRKIVNTFPCLLGCREFALSVTR